MTIHFHRPFDLVLIPLRAPFDPGHDVYTSVDGPSGLRWPRATSRPIPRPVRTADSSSSSATGSESRWSFYDLFCPGVVLALHPAVSEPSPQAIARQQAWRGLGGDDDDRIFARFPFWTEEPSDPPPSSSHDVRVLVRPLAFPNRRIIIPYSRLLPWSAVYAISTLKSEQDLLESVRKLRVRVERRDMTNFTGDGFWEETSTERSLNEMKACYQMAKGWYTAYTLAANGTSLTSVLNSDSDRPIETFAIYYRGMNLRRADTVMAVANSIQSEAGSRGAICARIKSFLLSTDPGVEPEVEACKDNEASGELPAGVPIRFPIRAIIHRRLSPEPFLFDVPARANDRHPLRQWPGFENDNQLGYRPLKSAIQALTGRKGTNPPMESYALERNMWSCVLHGSVADLQSLLSDVQLVVEQKLDG